MYVYIYIYFYIHMDSHYGYQPVSKWDNPPSNVVVHIHPTDGPSFGPHEKLRRVVFTNFAGSKIQSIPLNPIKPYGSSRAF